MEPQHQALLDGFVRQLIYTRTVLRLQALDAAAKELGIEPQQLQAWEEGRAIPGLRELARWATSQGFSLALLTPGCPCPKQTWIEHMPRIKWMLDQIAKGLDQSDVGELEIQYITGILSNTRRRFRNAAMSRSKIKWTRRRVAAAAGTTTHQLRTWETGRDLPDLAQLLRWIDAAQHFLVMPAQLGLIRKNT